MEKIYKKLKCKKYLEKEGYITDYEKMMNSLELLFVKNKEMYEHTIRVAKYSEKLACEFFDKKEKVDCVWISALFHDIGKVLVPNYILRNEDALTLQEFEVIKKHPYDGYKIAKRFLSEKICEPILEHHERMSGDGYPFEKKTLSLETNIVAVADTFDAMTSERLYQKSLTVEEAIEKLEFLSFQKRIYDENVVQALKRIIENKNS